MAAIAIALVGAALFFGFGYFVREAVGCRRPHGPLLKVPVGARATLELEGACEVCPGFAEVAGEMVLQVTSKTKLGPGGHDLRNVTIAQKPRVPYP